MRKLVLFSALLLIVSNVTAQDDPPNLPDGLTFQQIVGGLASGHLSLFEVRRRGLEVFTTPFNNQDGHGDGPFNLAEIDNRTPLGGGRPTLQGNGQFLRINGLDTQSCNECHTIVANGVRPPRLGIGGVGAVTQNAIIMPTMMDVEGIGFVDNEAHTPEEVLVVRPFGRKGENFSMRDFDRGAMRFHFGMQPVEVVGADVDSDGDGVSNEVTLGEMTALHIFDVTNPRPFIAPLNRGTRSGFRTFQQIGCVDCHRPVMQTETRYLPLAHPEDPTDPSANVYTHIDLVEVGFEPGPNGGVFVPFFADLKRHDMGPGLAESLEGAEIANEDFTTARLWGIADSAPYLHDGRATTLYRAISAHGGEAQTARDTFLGLSEQQQKRVIAFLKKLRTPIAPNEEDWYDFIDRC